MKGKPEILIVDDQVQNLELLEVYLASQGYDVVRATSGAEALEKLYAKAIDLILLDVMMPEINGFEVIRKVRLNAAFAQIPIILVTALRETKDRVRGIEAGCDDFISKPIDRQELLARVRSLLKIKAYHDLMSDYRIELEEAKTTADAAREYIESIIDTVREPLIVLDHDLRIMKVNGSFYNVFKSTDRETIGQRIFDLGNGQWNIPKLRELLENILPGEKAFDNFEVEHDFAIIGKRIMLLNARKINGSAGMAGVILLAIEDITERRCSEERIELMATHDSLTGLPNRTLYADRLRAALIHAQREQGKAGIAMLDLDYFKDVNDTHGHDVGDILLKMAAQRLSSTLRKGDSVARFGGDEFVLIFSDLAEKEDAALIAQKLTDSLRAPFRIGAYELAMTASIGIALYPDDGMVGGVLLKNADIAMHKAKQAGRAQYQFYEQDKRLAE